MYTDLKNIKQENSNDLQNIINKYGTIALEYCKNNNFFGSDKEIIEKEVASITFEYIGDFLTKFHTNIIKFLSL